MRQLMADEHAIVSKKPDGAKSGQPQSRWLTMARLLYTVLAPKHCHISGKNLKIVGGVAQTPL